ncbi:hypothetical protein KKC06_06780 [Patescibacteria group bacterium]|nr:hypothetical protein [Patescibacteria group bacterium]
MTESREKREQIRVYTYTKTVSVDPVTHVATDEKGNWLRCPKCENTIILPAGGKDRFKCGICGKSASVWRLLASPLNPGEERMEMLDMAEELVESVCKMEARLAKLKV